MIILSRNSLKKICKNVGSKTDQMTTCHALISLIFQWIGWLKLSYHSFNPRAYLWGAGAYDYRLEKSKGGGFFLEYVRTTIEDHTRDETNRAINCRSAGRVCDYWII